MGPADIRIKRDLDAITAHGCQVKSVRAKGGDEIWLDRLVENQVARLCPSRQLNIDNCLGETGSLQTFGDDSVNFLDDTVEGDV